MTHGNFSRKSQNFPFTPVFVHIHRLNNTHSLTYCSAQLTQTLNCKHNLQYVGFSVSLCVTCSYSYSSLPGIPLCGTNVLGNIRSLERKFLGTIAPGSESSQWELERKFPAGTFAPRSKNTGERKVPELELHGLSVCSTGYSPSCAVMARRCPAYISNVQSPPLAMD